MSQPELQREPAPEPAPHGDGEEADDALDPAFVARFGSGPLAVPAVPAWTPAAAGAVGQARAGRAMPDLGATAARPWAAWPRPALTRARRHGRARHGGGPRATVARALARLAGFALGARLLPSGPTRAVSAARPAPAPDQAAAPPPPGLAAAAAARSRLAWPLAGLVLGAYLSVLVLAAVAPSLAGGATGVALVLALAALAAAVAVLYPRLAAVHLDPLSATLAEQVGDPAGEPEAGGPGRAG
jgi:uncharacterized membrane protein (DUF485 family)